MAVEKSRHYLQSLLKELTVPLEYGTVTNRHIPDGEMRGLVVCVQDLPGNIGVYKNVAQIICFLSERYSFEYIFIGAAFGECSVMNFEGLSRRKTRRLARSLLEKGAMNGAEYAIAMRPDLELELWGIDEPVLYLKNAGQVRDMLEIKDVISNRIVHGRSDLLRIALPMLNTNLGDFLRIDQRYAEVRQTTY